MWEMLKDCVRAYQENVSDEVAQDAYGTVLEDMEKIEKLQQYTEAFPPTDEGHDTVPAHIH